MDHSISFSIGENGLLRISNHYRSVVIMEGYMREEENYSSPSTSSGSSNASSPSSSASSPAPELVGLPTDASTSTLLEQLLECPVCLEISKPPIFQCHEGHTLCHSCKPKVKGKCPLCRGYVPHNLRNRTLEAFYNTANFSCPINLCGVTVKGEEFERHVRQCPKRTVKCDFVNFALPCTKRSLPFMEMPNHLQTVHGVPNHSSGDYCAHKEYLMCPGRTEGLVTIPLAIWNFRNLTILQQLTIYCGGVCISHQLLNPSDLSDSLIDKIVVDLQIIRSGIHCAPSIRYGLYSLKISKFGEEPDYRNPQKCLIFGEKEFKLNIARYDTKSLQFLWTSRIDIKVPNE